MSIFRKFVFSLLVLVFLGFTFQNCSTGFDSQNGDANRQMRDANSLSGSPVTTPVPTPAPAPAPAPALKAAIPFVQVHLLYGAAIAGNIIVLDSSGNMLPDYSILGLGTSAELQGQMTTAFGASWYAQSGLLQGLREILGANDPRISTFAVAVATQDYSTGNKLNMLGLAHLVRNGSNNYAPNILGIMGDYPNGVPAEFPVVNSAPVSIVSDLTNISTLVTNSSMANLSWDPRISSTPDFMSLWNLTKTTLANSNEAIRSGLVFNALNGNAGPVGFTVRGFGSQYINPYSPTITRQTQNAQDAVAGRVIGQTIKSALLLNKPAFIVVTTDGAVRAYPYSPIGATWTSIGGQRSTQLFFIVDPLQQFNRSQSYMLGSFKSYLQSVDTSTLPGSSPAAASEVIVSNYFIMNGRTLADITNIMPDMGNTDITNYLKVGLK